MQTDRAVTKNKSYIIIRDNEKGIGVLIDRNVIKKEDEKFLKYKDLTILIHRVWDVKTKVTPVIMGGKWNHLKIISGNT